MNAVQRLSVIAAYAALGCVVSDPDVEIVEDPVTRPTGRTSEPEDSPAPSCERAAPPARQLDLAEPTAVEDQPPIYVAWSLITFEPTDGFDLDAACTDAPGCAHSERSCRSRGESLPDEAGCRDNGFAHLLRRIVPTQSPLPSRGWNPALLRCALWRGSTSIVMRISNYDGHKVDPRVRVDYYYSDGLDSVPAYQCRPDTDLSAYSRWRRGRPWGIDRASLDGEIEAEGELPDSRMFTATAYVEDDQLIAEWPDDTDLRFSGPSGLSLRIRDGLLRARIVRQQDGSASLREGVFAGRVRARDVLVSLRQTGVCQDDSRYEFAARFLDEHLDVSASGGSDPERDCDALSVGFAFEADAMTPGEARTLDASTECRARDRCGDGIWSGDEICDPAVAGEVGACPSACSSDDACTPRQLLGTGCEARCVDAPTPWAGAEDGCCPPGTPSNADPDCAALCGNGELDEREHCDTAIARGQDGACPMECSSSSACQRRVLMGSGCEQICVDAPITKPGDGDGCCPSRADATTDRDCLARCGNGVMEPGETCDPPSRCIPCATSNACLPVQTTGSADACTLRCEVTPITQCRNSDRCCPQGCSASNDADCSSSCGNRMLDPGETCEGGTSMPCPASCDDEDACTIDRRSGSAASCSIACTHSRIAEIVSGDGCCPAGGNSNVDDDCLPRCGNRAVELNEQCDDGNTVAGDGCENCRTESLEAACLDAVDAVDECAQCSCRSCPGAMLGCYAADSGTESLCLAVMECGARNDCFGAACYCGDAAFCLSPTGPCRSEVEAAAQSTVPADVSSRSMDANYAIGRAFSLQTCQAQQCASECR